MRKEVMDWLNSAEDDLETAEVLLKQSVFYACAFYCQQSAEKALKALFIHRFRKGTALHNLIGLANELDVPAEILSSSKRLNPHYIQTRYPDVANAIPKDAYDDEIAGELLEEAKKVFEWTEKQIMKK